MSRNFKRVDKRKVDEIRKVRQYFQDAGATPEEVYFAQVKKIPNATKREHEWAIDFLLLGKNPPDQNHLRMYNEMRRIFNRSTKNPNEHIIGVDYEIENIHGKKMTICYEQLAQGEPARRAALKCDAPTQGWIDKKEELLRMSRDKKLKRAHDTKMQQLERRARRK
jgi:hypothetical protein